MRKIIEGVEITEIDHEHIDGENFYMVYYKDDSGSGIIDLDDCNADKEIRLDMDLDRSRESHKHAANVIMNNLKEILEDRA